jgi:hypothetical protein
MELTQEMELEPVTDGKIGSITVPLVANLVPVKVIINLCTSTVKTVKLPINNHTCYKRWGLKPHLLYLTLNMKVLELAGFYSRGYLDE